MQGGRSTPSFALHFGLFDLSRQPTTNRRRSKMDGNRPRTRRPTSFTANYPHMDCGMNNLSYGGRGFYAGSCERKGAAGCSARNAG